MSDTILEMRDITKTFPGVRALHNVNFTVERGEIHCLVGENGAGKSTLMTETQQAQHAPVAHHYALICEDGDPFWDSVFSGAQGWAGENGVYLERFGSGLSVQYSRAERLKMAIAAGVDGILLQADESDEMGALIDRAVDAGIPVVTVMDDHYGSRQQSFVGLSNYTLGREYGRQIISCANKATKRALILMDANTADSAQNILYTGITQTLANEGNHLTLALDTLAVPDSSAFGPEQQVRDVLRQAEPPEIILCLDEQTTVCVLQTVIDLNMGMEDLDALRYWFYGKLRAVCHNIRTKKDESTRGVAAEVQNYIREHYADDLSLDDVSYRVNISPYYFSKLFKNETGMNFIDYLTEVRMEHAKELLSGSDRSVKEICRAVGYSDPNYFSRSFKKNVGVTPTEYKESL